MTKFDNNNRGVLFKNDKQGVESRADYRGNAEINHVEYWMDGWINPNPDGSKRLNVRFKRKDDKHAPVKPPSADQPDFDDKIPF